MVCSPHQPTYWWGNFLLLESVPAPGEAGMWLDRFTDAFPAADHVALGFDGTEGSAADLQAFAARDLSAEAMTVMTARTVVAPRPVDADVVIREVRSDRDWAQSAELRVRCNDRQIDPEDFGRFATHEARTHRRLVEGGHARWFGAFAGERLIAQLGLVSAGGGLARFQTVECDPVHRRRGIAGSLVHHAAGQGFAAMGADTLVIVADPDYVAIELYRKLGFVASEVQLQAARPPG